MIDLHHADAALHEAARHQALFAEGFGDGFADAVELFCGGRFALDVEGLRRFHLHAEGEFEGLDARVEPAVFLASRAMQRVQFLECIQFRTLLRSGKARVADIGDGLVEIVHERALIRGRQEAAAPERRAPARVAPG